MLRTLEIKNYRGFSSYRMEGLSQVNLLVGKNNSGKTALLEGVQFFTSGGDPSVLAEVAERRGEIVIGRTGPAISVSVDIAHFFNGHTLTLNHPFSFTGDNGFPAVSATIITQKKGQPEQAQTPVGDSAGSSYFLRIAGSFAGGAYQRDRDGISLPVSREGGVNLLMPSIPQRVGPMRRISSPRVRFIGPDSLNAVDLAVMWDEITLSGQELDIAAAMRALDSDVESVHFLTGMLASGYFPARGGVVVGLKNREGRVPLGSMGDGMRRVLALATSLAFTKSGSLFVDEIDTGLHYSVMPDIWKLLINKAAASQVQVFATTHSWDCIEGLSALCQQEPDVLSKVALHKIDHAIPHSVAFPGEAIVRMVKSDIDPR